MKQHKIVTIGGGTGSFALLKGLKDHPVKITAIVSMADDGGSTGRLRDELGVLPPGDVRQCLVALAQSDERLRKLFSFRYSNGGLKGHNFGNIFLSTLEKITGRFEEALAAATDLLNTKGRVVPVTLTDTRLIADLRGGRRLVGQFRIQNSRLKRLERLYLKPRAAINPAAREAILAADKIVICPGDIHTSILPNLLVKGVPEAIRASRAQKIYIANIMTQPGLTDGWTAYDFLSVIEDHLGHDAIDIVVANTARPPRTPFERYRHRGYGLVESRPWPKRRRIIRAPLLATGPIVRIQGDKIRRSFLRHDSDKTADMIIKL